MLGAAVTYRQRVETWRYPLYKRSWQHQPSMGRAVSEVAYCIHNMTKVIILSIGIYIYLGKSSNVAMVIEAP